MNIQGTIKARSYDGRNLALLVEERGAYVAYLFSTKNTLRGPKLSLIAKKKLDKEEIDAFNSQFYLRSPSIAALPAGPSAAEEVLYLPVIRSSSEPVVKTSSSSEPVLSPYFPSKDIFLTTQMTCAPNF